jgi:hypothetical protein
MSAITPEQEQQSSKPESRLAKWWPILLLILVPILVGLVHDDWLYSPVGAPDPYFNVGFFLHYFDPSFLPGMYKEARVPWLAPGYFAYHVMNPVAANFVLHVGCLVAAVALVYLSLCRLVSRNAAFIGAGLICIDYQFQGGGTIGGWDYQTTPSGAFYALTLYLLVRAAQTRYAAFWMAAAGMAFGATVHANIIEVNLTLGLAAIYLAANRQGHTLAEVGISILWALLGFVLINLILSMIAWDSGRDPLFFRTIFGMAASFTVDPATHQQRWWLPWSSGWFLKPLFLSYLIPLATIFLAAIAWMVERIRGAVLGHHSLGDENGLAPFVLVAQYAFAFALWVFWQAQGQTALQPDCFTYPLIIPAFMALVVMVGPVGKREMIGFAIAVATIVLMAAVLSGVSNTAQDAKNASTVVMLAMPIALLVAAILRTWRGVIALVAVSIYMAGYPAMAMTHQNLQPLWSDMVDMVKPCITPRLYFSETVRLNKLLRQPRPDGSRLWIWDGPDEIFKSAACGVPVEYFRTTLMATGLDALGSYHASADQIDDSEVRLANYGDSIVGIVDDKSKLDTLVARFKRNNVVLVKQSEDRIHLGRASGWVVVYLVQ